jgi:hypothetical protein
MAENGNFGPKSALIAFKKGIIEKKFFGPKISGFLCVFWVKNWGYVGKGVL